MKQHKARLVAQGFLQNHGVDYDETFFPVVRFESVRTVIALAAKHDLKLHQLDINMAFLNGELNEEIYMKKPEGFEVKGKEHLVCKLNRSLYGLKQSPRCWNEALKSQLKKMHFKQLENDPCIYTLTSGREIFIAAVYVDDIILASKYLTRIQEFIKSISESFNIKDMGKFHYFLGVKIAYPGLGKIWIGQPAYTTEVLKRFQMENSKPTATTIDTGAKLTKATEDSKLFNQELHQSAIGSLLYLSTRIRPDIAYAVSNVARFCSKPTMEHWNSIKHIMRYLNGTWNYGLLYDKEKATDFIGYSDADWAGDLDDRRSTSGYLFKLSRAAVSWRSKNNLVWHYLQLKQNTWHWQVQHKKLYGCNVFKMISMKPQLTQHSYMRITNLLYAWRKIHNIMEEQNILTLSSIISVNKMKRKLFNLNIVKARTWLLIC